MSDSVRSHRWKPTRLPHPWDSPGKSTGVQGCKSEATQVLIHFLLFSYWLSFCHVLSAGDTVVNKTEPSLSPVRKSILHCMPTMSPSLPNICFGCAGSLLQHMDFPSLAVALGLSCPTACEILVPWPGIEPAPPRIARWNLNHCTIREVPHPLLLGALHVSPLHLCNDSGRLLPCLHFTNEDLGQRNLLVVSVEKQDLTFYLPDSKALTSCSLNPPIPKSCEWWEYICKDVTWNRAMIFTLIEAAVAGGCCTAGCEETSGNITHSQAGVWHQGASQLTWHMPSRKEAVSPEG